MSDPYQEWIENEGREQEREQEREEQREREERFGEPLNLADAPTVDLQAKAAGEPDETTDDKIRIATREDNYLDLFVVSKGHIHRRIVVDIEMNEIRVYLGNDDEPTLRQQLPAEPIVAASADSEGVTIARKADHRTMPTITITDETGGLLQIEKCSQFSVWQTAQGKYIGIGDAPEPNRTCRELTNRLEWCERRLKEAREAGCNGLSDQQVGEMLAIVHSGIEP